jgi:KEOPS complex subunit Cgi121
MQDNPVVSEVRTARCTVDTIADFLRDLRSIAAGCNTHIICFNADMMAGRVHARTAVERAVRAFATGENISNTLEMECLLYAAGSRQCSIAASFGIHEGDNRVYLCCTPPREGIWTLLESLFRYACEDWETIGPKKREQLMISFAISPDEIAASGGETRLIDLVLERVALLQVTR